MLTPSLSAPQQGPLFACLPSGQVLDHIRSEREPESLLSEPEVTRAAALTRPDQQRDFVAARVLTRLLLRRWHGPGTAPASIAEIVLAQSCAECGGPHGRPLQVLGLAVSWAHAGGFVAAAVGAGPVGVDVEPIVPTGADELVNGQGAATSVRAWVRGEAILKWGHGTLDDVLTWQPSLEGRLAPRGQRYLLDDDGRPQRTRRPFSRGTGLVITDAPASDLSVCSVAASHVARWVDPLA